MLVHVVHGPFTLVADSTRDQLPVGPLIVSSGTDSEPPEVTAMAVTKPAVTFATAVAGSPALRRLQKQAIAVAASESHPVNRMEQRYHFRFSARKRDWLAVFKDRSPYPATPRGRLRGIRSATSRESSLPCTCHYP